MHIRRQLHHLDTKDRSQRRLTKRYGYLFAKTFQSVCQTDRGRGLSFSGWSRVDRGHQNQFSILALGLFQKTVVYLCLIISILLQILLVYACCLCISPIFSGFAACAISISVIITPVPPCFCGFACSGSFHTVNVICFIFCKEDPPPVNFPERL